MERVLHAILLTKFRIPHTLLVRLSRDDGGTRASPGTRVTGARVD